MARASVAHRLSNACTLYPMAPAFPMGELADVRSAQGLLLMPPSMFTLAGELTPAVLHVSTQAVATDALCIVGNHSDVMAARTRHETSMSECSPG